MVYVLFGIPFCTDTIDPSDAISNAPPPAAAHI